MRTITLIILLLCVGCNAPYTGPHYNPYDYGTPEYELQKQQNELAYRQYLLERQVQDQAFNGWVDNLCQEAYGSW